MVNLYQVELRGLARLGARRRGISKQTQCSGLQTGEASGILQHASLQHNSSVAEQFAASRELTSLNAYLEEVYTGTTASLRNKNHRLGRPQRETIIFAQFIHNCRRKSFSIDFLCGVRDLQIRHIDLDGSKVAGFY